MIYNSNNNNNNNNNNSNNSDVLSTKSSYQNPMAFDLANHSLNDLSLIKKPFKHYKQQTLLTNKSTTRSISVVSNERVNNFNSNANLKSPRTNVFI